MVFNKKFFKIIFQGVGLLAIIAGAFYLAHLAREAEVIREIVAGYGYSGVLLISFISGFNLVVPLPAVAFMPLFLEAGLDFWISVFFLAVGVTMGDFFAFYIGKFGRDITLSSKKGRVLAQFEHIRERYRWGPLIALFLFASFIPLPNEILLIPLGFLGYTFLPLFPVVIAGNFLFNVLYSAGVVQIFGLF